MGWNTYANRGSALEDLIDLANKQYKGRQLARIDKISTPGSVQGGYYKEKSTVDFTGVIKGGRMVAFDCKETAQKSLPLKNIYEHQIEYMQDVVNLGGYAFLIVHFKTVDQYYRLDFQDLQQFWLARKQGSGRASIPQDAFTTRVMQNDRIVLHYLKGLI